MSREIELTALSVVVTAVFGLLFSSLNVDAGRIEASIPSWTSNEIVVAAPDAGEFGRDLGVVRLSRPELYSPIVEGMSRLPDCGAAFGTGQFAITPPVLELPDPHADLGEIELVRPRIEMPDLRRPLPALMDLQRSGPILRIA